MALSPRREHAALHVCMDSQEIREVQGTRVLHRAREGVLVATPELCSAWIRPSKRCAPSTKRQRKLSPPPS
jgi:hypothetical protein